VVDAGIRRSDSCNSHCGSLELGASHDQGGERDGGLYVTATSCIANGDECSRARTEARRRGMTTKPGRNSRRTCLGRIALFDGLTLLLGEVAVHRLNMLRLADHCLADQVNEAK
jgi:hypothetical protein